MLWGFSEISVKELFMFFQVLADTFLVQYRWMCLRCFRLIRKPWNTKWASISIQIYLIIFLVIWPIKYQSWSYGLYIIDHQQIFIYCSMFFWFLFFEILGHIVMHGNDIRASFFVSLGHFMWLGSTSIKNVGERAHFLCLSHLDRRYVMRGGYSPCLVCVSIPPSVRPSVIKSLLELKTLKPVQ